jgi:hypothetical protein
MKATENYHFHVGTNEIRHVQFVNGYLPNVATHLEEKSPKL